MRALARGLTCAVLALPLAAQGFLEKKVILFGVDGCRPDALQLANTPNFDALVRDGWYRADALNTGITVSGPGWSNILCGVTENKHGVRDNSFTGSRYDRYPCFFRHVRDRCSNAWLGSAVSWSPIGDRIITAADHNARGLSDAGVAVNTVQTLQQQDPDVLFVYFGDVDIAGHNHGFSPTVPQYIQAIEQADAHIGQVMAAVRARPTYPQENWLVVLSSDHGGLGTGHGGTSRQEREIPFLVSGRSADRTAPGVVPTQVDVVPTILQFLGIAIDPAWGLDGRPLGVSSSPTNPPSRFVCLDCPRGLIARADHALGQVNLAWTGGVPSDATALELRRDGQTIATLPVSATAFVDTVVEAEPVHLQLRYQLRILGGPLASACAPHSTTAVLSTGDVRLADDFDDYADDNALNAAGWLAVDVNNPLENATWRVSNPGGLAQPASFDGQPTTGRFVASDSDYGGSGSNQNPPGSGMSHDLWSPSFDCSGMAAVHLHFDCTAVLNNNGRAVFDIDVSLDNGRSWTNAFRRVAPERIANAPVVTVANADGFFGRVDVPLRIAGDQPDVRFRIRHFEPNWDWWIAIDNVVVDDLDLARPGDVELLANESFRNGIPATWTVRGNGSGNGTWNTTDPCGRSTLAAGGVFPHLGGRAVNRLGTDFAIMDSDCANGGNEDEWLITPAVDCRAVTDVWLAYRTEVVHWGGSTEDVRVSLDGGRTFATEPLFSYATGALTEDEDPYYAERVLRVPLAAGQPSVAFAFRYRSGGDAWFWAVDDVRVTGATNARASVRTIGAGCGVTTPPTLTSTLPVLGTTILFRGRDVVPGAAGALCFSILPAAPTAVTPRCSTWLDLTGIVQVPATNSGVGTYLVPIPIPPLPALAGRSLAVQSLWFPSPSPDGFDLSGALRMRLGF